MSKIYVKRDGLYKDGKKLQLIFGDPEQVAAIRNYEKRVSRFNNGGRPDFITYEIKGTISFACICDNYMLEKTHEVDQEDDEEYFDQDKFECPVCKAKYEARYSKKTQEVTIHLLNL